MPVARTLPRLLLALLLMAVSPAWARSGEHPACKGQQGEQTLPYDSVPPPGYDHDRFGTGPQGLMFRFGAFTSSFTAPDDGGAPPVYRALPRWVAYEMHALMDSDGQPLHPLGARRPSKWYELGETSFLWDDAPGIRHHGLDASYRGFAQMWNRGHMAARGHANRLSWQEGCNTHVFVNALPQFAGMNQGDWEALENYAAALANRYGRVWTMAGPIFEANRTVEFIGRPGTVPVPVPHALYKILAIEDGGRVEARAFIFPQADADQREQYRRCAGTPQAKFDLGRYAVRISTIEAATGLRFFQRLDKARRQALDTASDGGPWPVAPRYYDESCGGRADSDDS